MTQDKTEIKYSKKRLTLSNGLIYLFFCPGHQEKWEFDNFFPNYADGLLLLTLNVWQGDCGTPHRRIQGHKKHMG